LIRLTHEIKVASCWNKLETAPIVLGYYYHHYYFLDPSKDRTLIIRIRRLWKLDKDYKTSIRDSVLKCGFQKNFPACLLSSAARVSYYPFVLYLHVPNITASFYPLTPELSPSAQRCLTRFLVKMLLLEPWILLIYA
jgi:hypothetical protein